MIPKCGVVSEFDGWSFRGGVAITGEAVRGLREMLQ